MGQTWYLVWNTRDYFSAPGLFHRRRVIMTLETDYLYFSWRSKARSWDVFVKKICNMGCEKPFVRIRILITEKD